MSSLRDNEEFIATLAAYELTVERRDAVSRAVADLGVVGVGSLQNFYAKYRGPFSSRYTGYELLDPVEQSMSIRSQTEELRSTFSFPTRYIVLSNYLANSVLIYDADTDFVYDMDFEGGDAELLQGTLAPAWPSFDAFLRFYFLGHRSN